MDFPRGETNLCRDCPSTIPPFFFKLNSTIDPQDVYNGRNSPKGEADNLCRGYPSNFESRSHSRSTDFPKGETNLCRDCSPTLESCVRVVQASG